MLPSFPKSQKILDQDWPTRMFEAKAEIFPHNIHPPVLPIVEGKGGDFEREDGQVRPLELKLHQTHLSIPIKDGKGLTLAEFDAKAREAGRDMGRQMFEAVLQGLDEAVKETGNQVQINGGNLKQDDIFRMLEMIEWNFDEQGNPTHQIVLGQTLAEEFKRKSTEWDADPEFRARIEAIKMRKKEDFNEREARRRLVV